MMIVQESLVKKLYITELDRLDPVTILVEDYGDGRSEVIIKCYDQSWTSYWGSMGGSVKYFFSRVNVNYLVNCFSRGIRPTTDNIDKHKMSKVFEQKIRTKIKEERYNGRLNKKDARLLWDSVDAIDFESIVPEHDHECFNWDMDHWSVDYNIWSKLFYDTDHTLSEFEQWLWENIEFEYENNYEYDYLYRIVEVVKDVLTKWESL